MVCCGVFVWSYWLFTMIVSCLYSSLTLSSVGVEWTCISSVKKCLDSDIINNATKTGAIVSSFVTMVQSINLLMVLMNNRKRYQGFCVGSAFHVSIIMVWYAVTVNRTSKKIDDVTDVTKWNKSTVNNLIHSSYYLACILSGIHMFWILVLANLIKHKRSVSMNEV